MEDANRNNPVEIISDFDNSNNYHSKIDKEFVLAFCDACLNWYEVDGQCQLLIRPNCNMYKEWATMRNIVPGAYVHYEIDNTIRNGVVYSVQNDKCAVIDYEREWIVTSHLSLVRFVAESFED